MFKGNWAETMVGRILTILLFLTAAFGCQLGKERKSAKVVEPILPMAMSRHDLVDYLNSQTEGLNSWRCRDTSVHVKSPELPMPQRLRGSLVCSAPSSFRLVSSSVVAHADFGSNNEICWAYAKPGESTVLTWRHEDSYLLQHLPGGFPRLEPEWLMTILGVRPLNADEYELQNPPAGSRELWLVSVEDTGNGGTTRRVIKVDTLDGVVREHALYDGNGKPLIRAQLSEYRNCGGNRLPHNVRIAFPQQDMQLTLNFGAIETNCSVPDSLWVPPQGHNLEHVDLGLVVRNQLQAQGRILPAGHVQESFAETEDALDPEAPQFDSTRAEIAPEFDEALSSEEYETETHEPLDSVSEGPPEFDVPRSTAPPTRRRWWWPGR